MTIVHIKKRDGRKAAFDAGKIAGAIRKAFDATGRPDTSGLSEKLADEVVSILELEGIDVPEVDIIDLGAVSRAATARCARRTTSRRTPLCAVSPFSPTRTTGTAARAL